MTKEELAEKYAHQDHEWHSCNGISLHPVREESYLAGFTKAEELAKAKLDKITAIANNNAKSCKGLAEEIERLRAKLDEAAAIVKRRDNEISYLRQKLLNAYEGKGEA